MQGLQFTKTLQDAAFLSQSLYLVTLFLLVTALAVALSIDTKVAQQDCG